MDGPHDLDLRSFYKQTFALLPTVSKKNLKGIKVSDPLSRKKKGHASSDAMPITVNDKFAMNCWNAFARFARPYTAAGGRKDQGMSFEHLETAVSLVHGHIPSAEVMRLADTLVWNRNELLSFEEFRRFCWQLFQDSLHEKQGSIASPDSKSAFESPARQSVDSFDKLSRQQHYISAAPPAHSASQQHLFAASSVMSRSSTTTGLSAIDKDAVCEVVKKENREKRRSDEYASYGEAIPRYQAGLEKNTVLSVCNPKERLHVKWRQTMARRKERDGKLKARHINKELSKVISASVQACDRMAVNNVLKNQDNAHYDMLVRNWETRRADEEQSLQNVERWRQEVYNMRIENIRTLKTSKMLSQQLVADHKRRSQDEDSVSTGSSFAASSGLFWGPQDENESARRFAVSTNSSSVVRVPADIENKIKNAKREKDFIAARQEKKDYIENTLSMRLKNYGAAKERNKIMAGLDCEVSISSIDGSDYFLPQSNSTKRMDRTLSRTMTDTLSR